MFARMFTIKPSLFRISSMSNIRQFPRLNAFNQPLLSLPSRDLSICLRTKVASKKLYKKYKLKNHNGAASRWLLIGKGGQFIRKQAGANHFNRKFSARKKYEKKKLVVANVQQKKLLKQLIPYFKKKYAR